MREPRVLIVGCGYLGIATARQLHDRGGWRLSGLRRNTAALPAFIRPVCADLGVPDSLKRAVAGHHYDYVIVAASAGENSDRRYRTVYVQGLENLLQALAPARPQRLLLVSSSRVWAQNLGQWVDERTPPEPADFAGRRLLEAEQLARASDIATTVVRCSGLYGPDRSSLIDRLRSGRVQRAEPSPYTNRIHRDDAAGFLCHLLAMDRRGVAGGSAPEALYIATDSAPARLVELSQWLDGQLGMDSGEERAAVAPKTAARPRYNRRLCNRRMLASGYRLRFADYRAGYAALLAAAARS